MARSRINVITDDLITDSGSVLWSFVKGEQLEFPLIVSFVDDITNYTLEAVVVEGANVASSEDYPLTVQPGGIQTTLIVRKPVLLGTWNAATAYNAEDVVYYSGLYYKLLSGAGIVDATTPDTSTLWEVTTMNKVYIQFPKTLASTWTVSPMIGYPVFGFFELRVTEPTNSILTHTWKPVRGMVEILFSPTDLVADL
jgi:hypothetical protein